MELVTENIAAAVVFAGVAFAAIHEIKSSDYKQIAPTAFFETTGSAHGKEYDAGLNFGPSITNDHQHHMAETVMDMSPAPTVTNYEEARLIPTKDKDSTLDRFRSTFVLAAVAYLFFNRPRLG